MFSRGAKRSIEILCRGVNTPIHPKYGYMTRSFGENFIFEPKRNKRQCTVLRTYSSEASPSDHMKLIKKLSKRTSGSIKEVKSALIDCNWDLEDAQKELRNRGIILASEKSSRTTPEGLLAISQNNNTKNLKINFDHLKLKGETTIENDIAEVAAMMGENVKLRKPDPLDLRNHKDWLSPTEVIKIFETLKDPHSTLNVLDQLSKRKDYKPNEALYTSVINSLSKVKDFDGIENVMKRIKREKACRLSDGFFYNVIRTYGLGAGRINRVIETLLDMPRYSCWPTIKTFNFVLNLLVNTRNFDVIHEVYMSAGRLGVEIDACCLNIMIKGLCKNGDVNAALQVFDELPKQGCKPNVRTFSALMHGLCEVDRVEEALLLFAKMETEGIEPDTILMNILISGLRKNGQVDKSIELFNTMLLKGCEPVTSTYQEVLYALIDSRKYIEAMNLAQKMSSKKMVISFNSYKLIIGGLCEENLVGDVDFVLKQMIEDGYVPKLAMWKQILQCILSENTNVDKLALKINKICY